MASKQSPTKLEVKQAYDELAVFLLRQFRKSQGTKK